MANKLVGQNYQTPDLIAKVTGRAKYADDYKVDGMLHARLLTSPLPHARARNIDVSRALSFSRSLATMALTISSWMANTSVSSRS